MKHEDPAFADREVDKYLEWATATCAFYILHAWQYVPVPLFLCSLKAACPPLKASFHLNLLLRKDLKNINLYVISKSLMLHVTATFTLNMETTQRGRPRSKDLSNFRWKQHKLSFLEDRDFLAPLKRHISNFLLWTVCCLGRLVDRHFHSKNKSH